ncbi:Uncharacterized protein C18orf19-like [Papilio machaon]|uniref:Uncharacterized protein C18orf19-like n=1 Tax=Papilio machaon TaxID=76193 RepID=A0A0N1IP73_PAPMA|nr:Uncharacterized protein C18orf19-like [Papilio machaon]
MALAFRILYRNSRYINDTIIPARWCYKTSNPARILASGICYQKHTGVVKSLNRSHEINLKAPLRSCSTQSNDAKPPTEPKKGLVQKFKEMYRDYWYVVLPVHMTTSAVWFGSFYYAVRSGVDVIGLLESLNISEKLLSPLKESSAGYFALGKRGTTFAIKKLQALGWIRPVPSRERIKEMIQERKENLQDRLHESKQHYQSQMREKGSQVMEEMKRYKTEMHNIKNKVKKM